MAKLIAIAAILAMVACGRGSNDLAPAEGRSTTAICGLDCCGDTPTSCGLLRCVDCTANMPQNTQAACIRRVCEYPCVAGFVNNGSGCASMSFSTSY